MEEVFLRQAIVIAGGSIENGGGPFGAVVVREGRVIASSGNRVTLLNDPTAHAEILAIREAARITCSWDLSGCDLYASCEPCPMCLGAIYWAGIQTVFYACSHDDAKDAGFDDSFIYTELNKEPGQRSIGMQQGLREEGLRIFARWMKYPDKKSY